MLKRFWQCAVINLREVGSSAVPGGDDLDRDLLNDGDALITPPHIVCPVETTDVFSRNIHPFKAGRIFHIDGFVLRITPLEFTCDAKYNLLTKMKLTVDFANQPENASPPKN
ncbi:MAG: hypothetical protein JSS81_17170 [Acidobacteria bacterium]|nr:hypothetical protein [Acidobacteriota bacterium]